MSITLFERFTGVGRSRTVGSRWRAECDAGKVALSGEPPKRGGRLAALPLRVNFGWMLAGNTYYSTCQWGMLTVMARLGTTETVGTYALALALTAPVFMLTNLQLRDVQATDAGNEFIFAEYIALRYVGSIAAIVLVCLTLLICNYDTQTTLVVFFVALAKSFESISDIVFGLLQRMEHMNLIALSLAIKGTLAVAILAAGLVATESIEWSVGGVAASWLIVVLGFDIVNARRFASVTPRFRLSSLGLLVKASLPLGIGMMLISLTSSIPRYSLEQFASRSDLGVFAAMAYMMVAGNTIANSLSASAGPRLAKYYANGERASYCGLLLKMGVIGAAMGVMGMAGAWLLGRPVLGILYGAEYAARSEVLIIVAAAFAVGCLATFCGQAVIAARRLWVQLPILVIVTATVVVSAWVLVPEYKLAGAAMTLVAAASVRLFLTLPAVIYTVWWKWHKTATVPGA